MARYATPRIKTFLYLAVTLPLWSSYVVRAYSWKLILAQEGIVSWLANLTHLDGAFELVLGPAVVGGPSLSVSATGIFLVFVYIWCPYMILPIQTALNVCRNPCVDASSDLGAYPAQTFRNVILPLALPGSGCRLHLHVLLDPGRLYRAIVVWEFELTSLERPC